MLVVVPLVVTYLVLKFLFQTIDGVLAPLVVAIYGKPLPGVGLLVTILLVMVTGWVAAGVAGGRLIRIWEGWLIRLPLIRIVYGAAKQFLESVSGHDSKSFKQVGLIEYPRSGLFTFCFLANRLSVECHDQTETRVSVFVPSTPTPFTGFVVLVKPQEIVPLDIPVEEAIKLLVSGGIVVPSQLVQTRGELT